MMEGWKYWQGRKVFIILKNQRQYSGTVVEIENKNDLFWITIIDKFGNRIGFSNSEIEVIQEEGKDGI